ncbi:MAG: tetratricopeptide repeat protein, partial [Gammaproteobacteria bacterium]|nr:tetratricopeptide repeat protein [Gammaproteobacteria bacterium]
AFARALALAPGAGPAVAELHRGLARAELERKRADRAIPELRRALAIVPGDRDSLRLLGIAAGRAGEPDEARRCLGRLLADGEDAEVLAELAVVECEAGDAAAAEELARRALAADPECAAAHVALARAALEQRRFAAAEAAARAAMALDPTDDAAPGWLGFALFNQGRLAEASDAFLAPVRRLRAPGSRHGDDHPTFARMSLTKLEQDIGQLEYLLAHERVDAGKAAVLEAYRAFAREHAAGVGRTTLLDVPRDHPVAPHYNRLLVDAPEPAIPGGALNPDLDFGAIAEAFHASRLGYVQVDDLLNRAALAALQRYSLEASIWFEMKFHSEVGSSLCNGYCCPLLLQIAADIERALPGIFAPHPFTTCWTYKYFQDETDGHIHADVGAASINLWVTPDEANLEPDSGGLLIWNKTLPKRLFRASGEEQMKASLALVAEPDAEPGYVPYRCNRAMIFRSNVLHKTERVKFKPGYADRRVSVTFLYGRPE